MFGKSHDCLSMEEIKCSGRVTARLTFQQESRIELRWKKRSM